MKNERLYDIEWTDGDGYHQDTGGTLTNRARSYRKTMYCLTIDEADARETSLQEQGAADIRIIQR